MKKFFVFLAFIGMIAACTNVKKGVAPATTDTVVVDSVVVDSVVIDSATVDSVQ